MIAAGHSIFLDADRVDAPLGRAMLSRLGSELALVYHDVMQAPLPGRWQALAADLDQPSAAVDRSHLDEISERPSRDAARSSRS